jgi:hypothetical protein
MFRTFLTLSLKLMQWYVTSVCRGSLYEKFGNKCVKILKSNYHTIPASLLIRMQRLCTSLEVIYLCCFHKLLKYFTKLYYHL